MLQRRVVLDIGELLLLMYTLVCCIFGGLMAYQLERTIRQGKLIVHVRLSRFLCWGVLWCTNFILYGNILSDMIKLLILKVVK